MRSLLTKLDWAIETAPDEAEVGVVAVVDPGVLIEPDEDCLLEYPELDPDEESRPGEVIVAWGGLRRLTEILVSKDIEPPRAGDRLLRMISHEDDHAGQVDGYRAKGVLQGAQLMRRGPFVRVSHYFTIPSGLQVPALPMAGAIARPLHNMQASGGGPSSGDLRFLDLLGFRGGVSEVGARSESWNERGKKPYIPLPRTYCPQR